MTDDPVTDDPVTGGSRATPSPAAWWRSRRTAVLLALLGGGVALLGQGRPWATGHAALIANTSSPLTLDGGSAAPGAGALALVALAGAVALATAGRAVRRVVAALLALTGVALVWLVVAARRSPQTLRAAIEAATGTTGGTTGPADGLLSWTAWPLVAAAGGLLVSVAAVLALRWSGTWQGPSARYEREPAPTGPGPGSTVPGRGGDAGGPTDPWEALSRGEDPTNRPG